MIKILIIDDNTSLGEFFDSLSRNISDAISLEVTHTHLNPRDHVKAPDNDLNELLNTVGDASKDRWDLILIDINLFDDSTPASVRLSTPLQLASRIRDFNRSAIIILYSGTLAKHIDEMIREDSSKKLKGSEKVVREIFESGIDRFISRTNMESEAILALREPSLNLALDRLLSQNSSLICKCDESDLNGKTFGELAFEVRRVGSKIGNMVIDIVLNGGVSALIDLNT